MPRSKRKFLALLAPLFFLFGIAATGCGAAKPETPVNGPAVADTARLASEAPMAFEAPMASIANMPTEVKSAPVLVQQAYQFAVANPNVLKQVPCYCGCGQMGHKSNYSCYVKSAEAGKVVYDNHALGCSICVDISQDAMRLYREGKSVKEIRTYVDAAYSRYGPSNLSE